MSRKGHRAENKTGDDLKERLETYSMRFSVRRMRVQEEEHCGLAVVEFEWWTTGGLAVVFGGFGDSALETYIISLRKCILLMI
jgi:hypothetical protein